MAEKGKLLPVCIVCGRVPSKGINDGIVVAGYFICKKCEKELTLVRQDDSRYHDFINKLKKFWVCDNE